MFCKLHLDPKSSKHSIDLFEASIKTII